MSGTGLYEYLFQELILKTPISDEPPKKDRYFVGDMWMRSDGVLHIYENSPVGGKFVATSEKFDVADLTKIKRAQVKFRESTSE